MPRKLRVREGVAVHRIIRLIVETIDERGLTAGAVLKRAGLHDHSLSHWASGQCSPKLDSLDATLNALGFDLVVVPRWDGVEKVPPWDK